MDELLSGWSRRDLPPRPEGWCAEYVPKADALTTALQVGATSRAV
jgi:hypothetical protein